MSAGTRSVKSVFPTESEFYTQTPAPSGGTIGAWPGRRVPPGRIHTAASSKSLSRRLLSFHLGSLPRVAAREVGEMMGTGEMTFMNS